MSIVIEQDWEWDDSMGLGSPMPTFWSKGHGHGHNDFVRAVVEHCIHEGIDIPAISIDDAPVEMWQQNIAHNESIEFRRTTEVPASTRSPKFPVTVLDLAGPRRGGAKGCGIDRCDEPWSSGPAVRVLIEPTDDTEHMAARFWLCREHSKRFPEPSYRICMIPVGAAVVLDPVVAS